MNNDRYSIDSHKLNLHPERLAQWLAAGQDWEKLKRVYPLYVEISPVGHCQHRCTFCAVDYIGYRPRALAVPALVSCLSDMAKGGVKSVMYAGEGEPLLHKDFAGIAKATKRFGIDVAVTTNAVVLTPELAESCLGSVAWLKASVNAGSKEAYTAIHQAKPDDWDKVWTNLEAAVKIRKAYGWPVTLGAQAVLLPENYETMGELCELARHIGLDYVVIKPYSQHPSSTETAERYGNLTYENQVELEGYLRRWNTNDFQVVFRLATMAHLNEPERPYQTCYATPSFWAYIMASGDVYGCGAHLLDQQFCFGNINTQQFSEIWEGDRRRQNVELMEGFDISCCRKNCRMEHVNRALWRLKHPEPHDNFI